MSGANKHEVIGRFRLGDVIGSGGFGTVHRALDPDGNRVAVKLLAPHMDSEETLERFHREGTIRIEHSNVVRVLDAGRDDNVSFIAFELLEGDPLSIVLKDAPLPLAQVLDAAAQICAGLTAAHERAIVHRDLKPANVFCCEDGVIKILDFGIARPMSQPGPQLTMAGAVIGTPGYLSPEQAKGDPNISPAADLWSLGVILYQALSGENPFLRQSAVATILAVVLEDPPPIEATDIPPGLIDAVFRCLDKDPSRRWETAAQLATALAAIDLDETPAPASIEASAIAEDERRVVALLLATEVRDLAALEAAVDEHGGRLTPMLGGAIGVFGGETYEGDEARRAVSAALSARNAATLMAVSTGRATGTQGTVSGEAVRAVERAIEAKLMGVAVGAHAARMLRGQFELRPVSGREDVFEVPRALTRRETGELLAIQPDRPLLGRSTELSALDAAVARALESSRASVIWVSGPPGIGKSRLRIELERRLHSHDELTVLSARGESHRRDVAFHTMSSLLRSVPVLEPFFLNPGISEPQRERALRDFLAGAFNDAAWASQCFGPLAKLLGLSLHTDPSGGSADAQLLADRMRISIADLLCEMARRPLAIILDDGQWVDEQTLSLLDRQVRRLSDRPLLVFIAARPELSERRPALFEGPRLRRVEPEGLPPEDVSLLAEIYAGREVPTPVVEAIAARTGGNPFFVEQIMRELIEQDLLDHELESLPMPLDVEGAVQSRLDHLPREEKLVCKRAAVFTRSFTAPALEALEIAGSRLHLQQLERRGLVSVPRALSHQEEYRFESSLVAEVAYGMNTDAARIELHRLAAAFLRHRPDVDHEELARHHDLGGEPKLAAQAYAEAARAASSRGDSASVLRCSERAFDLGLDGDAAVELHLACADALSFLGEREHQRASLDRALELAVKPSHRALALSLEGSVIATAGEMELGLRLATEGVAVARGAGDPEILAIALAREGWVKLYAGHVSEAAVSIGEAASVRGLSPATEALVASWKGQLYTAMGDLHRRKLAMQEAVQRYRAIGDLRRAATSEMNLADTFNRVGAYEQAEAALRDALASCRRVGNRVVEGYALANLGYALTGQGQIDEALAAFADALALAEQLGQPRLALAVKLYRARALKDREPPARQAEIARAVAREANQRSIPSIEASALAIASRAALTFGDVDSALRDADRALELRDAIGTMEEDESEIFLALAEALLASGDAPRAKEILARGTSRLEFLAGRIQDTDWRARFLVEVPVNRRLIELEGGEGR